MGGVGGIERKFGGRIYLFLLILTLKLKKIHKRFHDFLFRGGDNLLFFLPPPLLPGHVLAHLELMILNVYSTFSGSFNIQISFEPKFSQIFGYI